MLYCVTALIMFAEKLPLASRRTSVFGVFAEVAVLIDCVALPTLAAVWPPTVETTVAPCVPDMSPDKLPVKFAALAAVSAVSAFRERIAYGALVTGWRGVRVV